MLEMYMLAKDEDLYLQLKRKYLNVEGVKQMLQDRDSTDSLNNDELFIFMKLGWLRYALKRPVRNCKFGFCAKVK
ncbi:MAG: hypothetical protein Q7J27_08985 [Syntrophales bacterium]|nr:hypothetical protein [Syntrophales bacterium]